ncbi:MAG: hypothetical protein WD072_09890 [Pirellulales bacterium]
MRVILHIGQHKTGSKALQSALYASRGHLAERGFVYPVAESPAGPLRPYHMNHHGLFEAVRAAVWEGSGPASAPGVRACLHNLLAARPVAAETVILSAEDLFDMHTAHEEGFTLELVAAGTRLLAHELAGLLARVTVVCYLRRQDHLLAAHYAQFIKGSNRNHLSFREFHAAFAPRLAADPILACWEAAFGTTAMIVCPYEPVAMPGGIVADFFKRALRLEPPPVRTPYPDDLEAHNVTPSRDYLEFMRLLNRRSAAGRPVLPREHVLEAAFRDRSSPAVGVAGWLSPGERNELLTSHEPGNRRIAARHGLGQTFYREPVPDTAAPWTPPRPPGLRRLVELELLSRATATLRPAPRGSRRRVRRRPRQIIWIESPQRQPADNALAAELFGTVAGHPDFEPVILPRLGLGDLLARWHRVAVVVLVGPATGGRLEAAWLWTLWACKTRVVRAGEGPLFEEIAPA